MPRETRKSSKGIQDDVIKKKTVKKCETSKSPGKPLPIEISNGTTKQKKERKTLVSKVGSVNDDNNNANVNTCSISRNPLEVDDEITLKHVIFDVNGRSRAKATGKRRMVNIPISSIKCVEEQSELKFNCRASDEG